MNKSQQPDLSKAPVGSTHWSPAIKDDDRLEAFWRPNGNGYYDCFALSFHYEPYWQRIGIELPSYAVEITRTWDGEGLPPVGAVCEYTIHEGNESAWKECRVVAHDAGIAVIVHAGNYRGYSAASLRPIRTPEQIIAKQEREERIKAATAWLEGIAQEYGSDVADKCEDILMEAENRKQVAPDVIALLEKVLTLRGTLEQHNLLGEVEAALASARQVAP